MFVIELQYKAPLAEIDAAMAAHVAFLKKHYASGHFLVSGRKIPRDGGIIIAAGSSRVEIEAIVREVSVRRGRPGGVSRDRVPRQPEGKGTRRSEDLTPERATVCCIVPD